MSVTLPPSLARCKSPAGPAPAKRSSREHYAVASESRLNAIGMHVTALATQMINLIDEAAETGALEEAEQAVLAAGGSNRGHAVEALVQLAADLHGARWSLECIASLLSGQCLLTRATLDEMDAAIEARHAAKRERKPR